MWLLITFINFPKVLSLEEEGALETLFTLHFRHPTHFFFTLSLPNTFEGRGYYGRGVNKSGQRLVGGTPAQFFFRCGLSFFFSIFFRIVPAPCSVRIDLRLDENLFALQNDLYSDNRDLKLQIKETKSYLTLVMLSQFCTI